MNATTIQASTSFKMTIDMMPLLITLSSSISLINSLQTLDLKAMKSSNWFYPEIRKIKSITSTGSAIF